MTTKALYKKYITSKGVSTDTRTLQSDALFFALSGAHFNGKQFAKTALDKGASYAIIDDPNYYIDDRTILVSSALTALQELASYHRSQLNIPILAITGSNGKTTSKELINQVLSKRYATHATKGNLNNHIGVPLTLLGMSKTTELGIVEMGANHPNEIDFLCSIAKPNYGYITNFGKAHLEGFGSLKGVIQAKTELYRYIEKNNGLVFVNIEDPEQVLQSKTAKRYLFGSTPKADVQVHDSTNTNNTISLTYNGVEINTNLIGRYNINNLNAAIAIGTYFKVPNLAIKAGIESYTPNNNRSQIIKKGSLEIILDAYNANPSSMEAAILNLSKYSSKKKILILGDMFELGINSKNEHGNTVNLVTSLNFDAVIFIGANFYSVEDRPDAFRFYETLSDFKPHFNKKDFTNSTLLIKGSRGMALEKIIAWF